MMLYAIVGEDHPGTLTERLAVRPAHLERLQALSNAGRLLAAGPCPAIDSPDPGIRGGRSMTSSSQEDKHAQVTQQPL